MNLIRWALGIDADLRNFDRLYADHGRLVLKLEQRLEHMESTIGDRLRDLLEHEERLLCVQKAFGDIMDHLEPWNSDLGLVSLAEMLDEMRKYRDGVPLKKKKQEQKTDD